jgi:hypothetical protein
MGSRRPSAMIVLSAITVGIASGVGAAAAPAPEHAVANRLSPMSTKRDRNFMMFTSVILVQ